ncbi:MAG TPA: DUF3788 family protein [Candidatus Limnocylindrales bacterium]|nr:DUF3788 family protein [Candidatus Limnocylindrales bacterium]
MALSAFADPARQPSPDEVDATLANAVPQWHALIDAVRDLAEGTTETWAFAGPTFGWSMRLVDRGRVLVYLTPQAGHALVGLALGEKAIAAADAARGISDTAREVLDAAPRYAEGRGIRFPMATDDDLAVAIELARVKLGR